MRKCEFCKIDIPDNLSLCSVCDDKINGLRKILGKDELVIEQKEANECVDNHFGDDRKFKRDLRSLVFIILILIFCIFLVSSQRDSYIKENKVNESVINSSSDFGDKNLIFENRELFGESKLTHLSNDFENFMYEDPYIHTNLKEEVLNTTNYKDVSYEDKVKLIKISKSVVNLSHEFSTLTQFPNIKTNIEDWIIQKSGDVIKINSYLTYVNKNLSTIRDNFEVILRENGDGYKLIDLFINDQRIVNLVY